MINEQPIKETLDSLASIPKEERKLAEKTTQKELRENLENEKLKEEINAMRQDREERKFFSKCLFLLTIIYLVFVLLIIWGSSLKLLFIETSVLIALLCTTTGNIIGLFFTVVKYLFPVQRSSDSC